MALKWPRGFRRIVLYIGQSETEIVCGAMFLPNQNEMRNFFPYIVPIGSIASDEKILMRQIQMPRDIKISYMTLGGCQMSK